MISIEKLNNIQQQASVLSCQNQKKIQIRREDFVNLCEKYKSLRKLIIPITYYYEPDVTSSCFIENHIKY